MIGLAVQLAVTVITLTTLTGSVVGQATTDDEVCGSSQLPYVVNLMRDELKDVIKAALGDSQNVTIRDELKDIKATCTGPTSERPSPSVDQKTAAVSALTNSCVPLLIQQNVDGSNFFNRSWAEFKVGFSNNKGNLWLGNDVLSQLTLNGNYKLRFELQLTNFSWYWAEYSTFIVKRESAHYQLIVSGYQGNAGFDALGYQNGMEFTTYDRDNDPWTNSLYNNNCAVRKGSGFWYKTCALCSVNTMRGRGNDFSWYAGNSGRLLLKTSRMWLTCQ